jgi:nitroreductase
MIDLLRQRRSIRQFQSRPVEPAQIDLLIEAMLRAPSSRGHNPWEFIVVTDPDKLRALSRAKPHGAGFLAGAPLAIIVAADPQRCDVWIEDCAIAAILLQLTATSLGLGSCWVQIRLRPHADDPSAEAFVREVAGLPETLAVDCIVGIGYPAEAKPGHPRTDLLFNQVHFEKFGIRR